MFLYNSIDIKIFEYVGVFQRVKVCMGILSLKTSVAKFFDSSYVVYLTFTISDSDCTNTSSINSLIWYI